MPYAAGRATTRDSMSHDIATAVANTRATKLLAAALILSAPVAVYAHQGMVLLLILALFAQPNFAALVGMMRTWARRPETWLATAFFAWCLVTLAWTPRPNPVTVVRVALVAVAALLVATRIRTLTDAERAWLGPWAAAAGLLMLALFGEEMITHGLVLGVLDPRLAPFQPGQYEPPIMQHASRGAAVLAPLSFAFAALLAGVTKRAWLGVTFVAAALWACMSSTIDASWLAISCGAIAYVVTWRFPRFAVAGFFAALVSYALLAPIPSLTVLTLDDVTVLGDQTWHGIQQRVGIWQYAASLIAERPLTGHGFDAARVLSERGAIIPRSPGWPALPLHTHNILLQIWLELGAVGALMAGGGLALVGRRMWALTSAPATAALAMSTFTACAVISLISYGAWQYWWIATWGFAAALVVLARTVAQTRPSSPA